MKTEKIFRIFSTNLNLRINKASSDIVLDDKRLIAVIQKVQDVALHLQSAVEPRLSAKKRKYGVNTAKIEFEVYRQTEPPVS